MTKYLHEERFVVTSQDKDSLRKYAEGWERTFGADSGEQKPVYYAHPLWLYNTETERADVDEIVRQFGSALNPNAPEHEAGYQARKARDDRGMDYFFEDVLPGCRACVFRADADGKVSSGVALEVAWFAERGLPTYEIVDGTLVPAVVDPERVLTREESRARCGK